jgi:hypothetical protein
VNKVLGSLFSLGLVGGFVYLIANTAGKSGGLTFTEAPKVGNIVSIQLGIIRTDGVRITNINGREIIGVDKTGRQIAFPSSAIIQGSLSIF